MSQPQMTLWETINRRTSNDLAPLWPENYDPSAWEPDFWRFMEYFCGKRVLDIGCGSGEMRQYFVEHGLEYTGIDFSMNMITQALAVHPEGDFRVIDFYHMDFPQDSFDGFWASCSLSFVPKRNLDFVLAKIRHCVKNYGVGFIAIEEGDEEVAKEFQQWWMKEPLLAYVSRWNRDELVERLDFYGFVLLDVVPKFDGGPTGYFVRVHK